MFCVKRGCIKQRYYNFADVALLGEKGKQKEKKCLTKGASGLKVHKAPEVKAAGRYNSGLTMPSLLCQQMLKAMVLSPSVHSCVIYDP